jgi:hypothetical protein
MTKTSTATARKPLPTIAALDMLHAQGWKPSADELAAIKARADFFESEGMTREVHLKVVDVYTNTKIGEIIYSA